MPDESHLDQRYFVDGKTYNCPFCNRRHVAFRVKSNIGFDWTDKKPCWAAFVVCASCRKESMHLSFAKIPLKDVGGGVHEFDIETNSLVLDDLFFYSVPTSFFVLDERIPKILRELLSEAEGCLKSNFLTGASACARKMIYELALHENAEGGNYDERIKSLKKRHPEVDGEFFDTLLTVQEVTSTKVHEKSYDKWEAKHLRVILAALSEVLRELYVVPAVREDKRKRILSLKEELTPKRDSGGSTSAVG